MARSDSPTYTAADRYERRAATRSRRYRRHLTAVAIRAQLADGIALSDVAI